MAFRAGLSPKLRRNIQIFGTSELGFTTQKRSGQQTNFRVLGYPPGGS